MNYYLTAIEGLPRILDSAGSVLGDFRKNRYKDAFQKLYLESQPVLEALEQGYLMVIDKDQYLTNMAEALAESASARVEACRRRGAKERVLMDLNLAMAVYLLPMVLEYRGESSRLFADKAVAAWKAKFPKTNIQAAEFTYIEQGFHKKYCYITTAVCETLGRPDDCYELNLLRNYRDTYLASLPDGDELIRRYYDVAPSIVKHIGQSGHSGKIYQDIWLDYIQPCIRMIENGEAEECRKLYEDMVVTLEKKFFRLP